MPPVRWRVVINLVNVVLVLFNYLECVESKDFVSMTSDGWKPILGSGLNRKPIVGTIEDQEITQYRNPMEIKNPIYKQTNNNNNIPPQSFPLKLNKEQNYGKKKSVNRLQIANPASVNKVRPSNNANSNNNKSHRVASTSSIVKKQKPQRSQIIGGYSNKNEVYLAAPSSSLGSYIYFNRNPNVKVKDVSITNKGVNSNGQYTSFFTLPGLPSPRPTPPQNFIFPNNKQQNLNNFQNEINYYINQQQQQQQLQQQQQQQLQQQQQQQLQQQQQKDDEYSKNLVPPPLPPPSGNEQTGDFNSNKERLPENLVVQVPPPFGQQLNVFSNNNNVPLNYYQRQPSLFDQFGNLKTKKPYNIYGNTYEVTESSYWENPIISSTGKPIQQQQQQQHDLLLFARPSLDPTISSFLPTPVRNSNREVIPTSATKVEVEDHLVSTVFTKVTSNINNDKVGSKKRKNNGDRLIKPTQPSFDIKEVSTHFPIVGNPIVSSNHDLELTNEVTTKEEIMGKPQEQPQQHQQQQIIVLPNNNKRRRRPNRPINKIPSMEFVKESVTNWEIPETTTTTINYSNNKRRRINKYRTTTTTTSTTSTELPNINFDDNYYNNNNNNENYETTTEQQQQKLQQQEEEYFPDIYKESTNMKKRKRIRTTTPFIEEIFTTTTTTTEIPSTTFYDFQYENSERVEEIKEETEAETELSTTLATTSENPTTSTTTSTTVTIPTTTKFTRSKNRIKTRPRFSVKDYRQRLSQYSTSSSTTTTTPNNIISTSSNRLRYPIRSRKPTTETTLTESNRFAPKLPRYSTSSSVTESSAEAFTIATEKPIKAINTRLRPFGRYRSTTTTTEPNEVFSVQNGPRRTNLFTNSRRPVYPSLKTRIMDKNNRAQSTSITTTEKIVEENDESNEEQEENDSGMITAKIELEDEDKETSVEENNPSVSDTEQDESTIQQRISELTASPENNFNNIASSATSRIIPSHFTISTEDPVLPIETFFSSFKLSN